MANWVGRAGFSRFRSEVNARDSAGHGALDANQTNRSREFENFVTCGLYLLSALVILMRLWVIRYVTEAGDDHLEVALRYLRDKKLPHMSDCIECYHPKLYYIIEAKLFTWLPVTDRLRQIQLGAYLNWVLVGALILATYWFLRAQPIRAFERAIAFALLASSPGVTTVTAQPSNDAMVAAMSGIAICAYWLWAGNRRKRWLGLATIAAGAAGASKGSGLVPFAAIAAGLIAHGLFRRGYRRQAWLGLVLIALTGVGVWYSGYRDNWLDHHNALAINLEPDKERPTWTTTAPRGDGGCVSIRDSYLTFPIASLLQTPHVVGGGDYPTARRSLWTMMHGNHFALRYLHWPPSWMTTEPFTLDVSRAGIALGLVPASLFLLGLLWRVKMALRVVVHLVHGFRVGVVHLLTNRNLWLTCLTFAVLAMLIKLTMMYRWFPTMKSYYAYTGLVAFTGAFASGLSRLRRSFQHVVGGLSLALVLVHLCDTTVLAADLSHTFEQRARGMARKSARELAKNEKSLATLLPDAKIIDGSAKAGTAVNGGEAFCGRQIFTSVIGTSPSSNLEFRRRRKFQRLSLGVCNGGSNGSQGDGIRFRVFGDDKLLFESNVLELRQLQWREVSVEDVDKLRLSVSSLENQNDDVPLWLNPVLR